VGRSDSDRDGGAQLAQGRMKFRIAKKVVWRWSHGLGNYYWNRMGTVIRAHRKLETYYRRRGRDDVKLPGLPAPCR